MLRRIAAAAALALTAFLLTVSGTAPARAQTSTESATLVWTAPGDDGLTGRASQYALRYSTTAIAGTDTLSWWNNASIFSMAGRVPSAAGTPDSVTVTGLASSARYYFIIRAADEVPNWSGFSNIAVVDTRDAVAPLRISDLRVR